LPVQASAEGPPLPASSKSLPPALPVREDQALPVQAQHQGSPLPASSKRPPPALPGREDKAPAREEAVGKKASSNFKEPPPVKVPPSQRDAPAYPAMTPKQAAQIVCSKAHRPSYKGPPPQLKRFAVQALPVKVAPAVRPDQALPVQATSGAPSHAQAAVWALSSQEGPALPVQAAAPGPSQQPVSVLVQDASVKVTEACCEDQALPVQAASVETADTQPKVVAPRWQRRRAAGDK